MNNNNNINNPQTTTPPTRTPPFREDCWTEDATSTLVDTWGRRYLELNRGNLRQKDWQDVADAVNDLHGHTKKTRRTDVQCKNRIDTLKKKYKVEKAKIVESNGGLVSSWPFYERLEVLIGSNYDKLMIQGNNSSINNDNSSGGNNKMIVSPLGFANSGGSLGMGGFDSTPMGVPLPYGMRGKMGLGPPVAAMVNSGVGGIGQKRGAGAMEGDYRRSVGAVEGGFGRTVGGMEGDFRRNYSAMAAAAAKAGMEEEEGEEEDEGEEGEEEEGEEEGMRKLAKAIERFGEIYERVEEMKQRQMVELEKQRMQFTKDLEVQRMQLFMDTQVQLEKIKRAKHSGGGSADEIYR